MNRALTLLGGLAAGSGLMYMLDPDRGRRRRALVRDKTVSAVKGSGDAISKTTRDLANRAKGAAYESTRVFRKRGEEQYQTGRHAAQQAKFALMRDDWPPAWRAVSGVAGGALAVYGIVRRDALGAAITAAGATMITRAATNREASRLFGLVKKAAA